MSAPHETAKATDVTTKAEHRRVTRLQKLTARLVAMVETPWAIWAMAFVAVVDGSVFPVPPFALLIPMVLAKPNKAWRYALVGTIASLIGGLIGYGIGQAINSGLTNWFSVDPNLPIRIDRLGWQVDTTLAKVLTEQFWLLAVACSILPTPYKVVAISSGLVGVGLPQFFLASVIGRSIRFALVTFVVWYFGEPALRWITKQKPAGSTP